MLSDEELLAIRERADRATQGPWHLLSRPWCRDDVVDLTVLAGNIDPHKGDLVADCQMAYDWTEDEDDPRIQERRNADFIAHARTDVPRLLDYIDALKAENARLRAGLVSITTWYPNAVDPRETVANLQERAREALGEPK